MSRVLVINGSPKPDGNTSRLVRWFCEGCRSKGVVPAVVEAGLPGFKAWGCNSCRACQNLSAYSCLIKDDVRPVLAAMAKARAVVMATPLYFFSASAQLKAIVDRMFSLYKWDNPTGNFRTPLAGKNLVLLASACEDIGLDALEKPFALTAAYTGMSFHSLLVPNAGISGEIENVPGIREKLFAFGRKIVRTP